VRFGLTILPEERWAQAALKWRAAEDLGWDDQWTYDHLVWGGLPESPWFGAVPTLTAAASVTRRVGLGTFVASPNFRHPVPFVRDALALDDISGGRLLLGVGTGGDLDAAKLGDRLPLKARVDRFHEWARLLRRLLDEDHVDHDGEHFRAVDARTLPGPVAAQGIPLLIAANGPRSIRLAAEVGDGWVTYGGAGETLEEWWDHVAGLAARLEDALGAAGRGRRSRSGGTTSPPSWRDSTARWRPTAGRRAPSGGSCPSTPPRSSDCPARGSSKSWSPAPTRSASPTS
jgi:alkanesulfonate monooxygenase SsuD/methylene tetrahydromethanopterin reductase-like flavin-dependent oxidoreductase (luciferase family)